MYRHVFLAGLGLLLVAWTASALKPGDCEVCISVLDKFSQTLSKEDLKDKKKVEDHFRNYCRDLKLKENRFVSC